LSTPASVIEVSAYLGPLREEPSAVELHNTVYAVGGELIDGLAGSASSEAWVAGLASRLPTGGRGAGPKPAELMALREAVRQALQAVIDGARPSRASIEMINQCCARAPRSRLARWRANAKLVSDWDFGRASRADVVLSALAADAVELLTGPDRANLRACGAPGCVLVFVKDHPRREWCSGPCGNRARQARHYRRTRERTSEEHG
jgi:predicted RNA-binding Zn ribbon-like protein